MKPYFLMNNLIKTFILVAFCGHNSHAIITRFDPADSARWAKGFSAVCQVVVKFDDGEGSFNSGVLISPTEVLTAAHAVHAGVGLEKMPLINFNFKGDRFDKLAPFRIAESILAHPDHGMDEYFNCAGVDLAILKFKEPIADIPPVKLYTGAAPKKTQAYIVGYGAGGLHDGSKYDASYTRHMGTTRVSVGSGLYLESHFLPTDLAADEAPRTFRVTEDMDKYQSLAIDGDSGGPLLLKPAGILSVAGIYHGGVKYSIGGEPLGAISHWLNLSPHLDWIRAHSSAS